MGERRGGGLCTTWDAVFADRPGLDAWLGAARAAGLEPLIAFNHSTNDRCDTPCVAPTRGAYARAFRAFRRRYPWVRAFSPWNEANHPSQPTATDPRSAAAYFDIVRTRCRGCTIVAADVLDSSNMVPWVQAFLAHVRGRPRLWGLHNYRDVNRFQTRGTARLLRMVRGPVWLTETGGVTEARGTTLGYDEARAARATRYLFRIARRYRRRIPRIYLYQWRKTNPADDFDAGLVREDGTPRPTFDVVRAELERRRAGG